MTLNSTFIAVLGRIDGKFGERPMMLDFSKVEYFIPSIPWRRDEDATTESDEMTAVLSSGTCIIFRVKDKDGKFLTFTEFKKAIVSFQKTPETILVDNADSQVAGKKYFNVRS